MKLRVRIKYSAFTLIECIISLVVLSSILLTFSLFIRQTEKINLFLQSKEQKEWLIFLAQLDEEVSHSTNMYVKENRLYYEKEKIYILESHQEMIRKRSMSGGHQPMLTGVEEVEMKEEKNSISLIVTFKNGESMYGIWTKPKRETTGREYFIFHIDVIFNVSFFDAGIT
ncbi:hypothetical protein A5844_002198 [Enterococcus sp. 10A9_DIV0425]|uniref:Prepilin-type N-terminal cleavage/methylation domain-containing protein n=1 Tax=Candidatus Enterococcus wittei TaxID=1987383 RepID=A0A242JYV0_9ENTE|nr:competence type IV pilus minor pilin ComGF [Enterococcus sp. 10A9_DIV0425]OTP10498.1 hypothetical protein A5844_002198 [Enterococcus sp. 10A9_DIV0425]